MLDHAWFVVCSQRIEGQWLKTQSGQILVKVEIVEFDSYLEILGQQGVCLVDKFAW